MGHFKAVCIRWKLTHEGHVCIYLERHITFMLLSCRNRSIISCGKRRRNFISGSRNGELASTSRLFSVCRTNRHNMSMNLGVAAGIWWKMPMMVAIFCSFSPFFDTPRKIKRKGLLKDTISQCVTSCGLTVVCRHFSN